MLHNIKGDILHAKEGILLIDSHDRRYRDIWTQAVLSNPATTKSLVIPIEKDLYLFNLATPTAPMLVDNLIKLRDSAEGRTILVQEGVTGDWMYVRKQLSRIFKDSFDQVFIVQEEI